MGGPSVRRTARFMRNAAAVALGAATVAAFACTGSANEGPLQSASPADHDSGFLRSTVQVSESMAKSLADGGASTAVVEFVHDGMLDFSEYEQGVLAYVGCMQDYGWISSPGYPRLAPWGQYQVQFQPYTAETREKRGASEADLFSWEAECGQAYWEPLSRLWDAEHSASEAEEQAARDTVASCLQQAGVDIEDHPAARGLYDRFFDGMNSGTNMDAWVSCIRSVEQQQFTSGTGISFAP